MLVHAGLRELLAEQCGIATREQLRDCGLTRSWVDARLDAGLWRSLNDLVICTHNGPMTVEQQRWAAYCSASGLRALCGLTGMAMWNVRGFVTPAVHILVVRGDRVLDVPGVEVRVHESRRFSAGDLCTGRCPAVTSLARSTIDAAVWTDDSSAALRIAVAPVQQRRMSAQRLYDELMAAGWVRHRRILRPLYADLTGGAQALSEVAFLRWCRRHGLPRPQLQVRLDGRGRRRYLDAVFRCRDGSLLYVEIDGGIHLDLTTRWLDTMKDNDLVIAKKAALRFPSIAIYTDHPVAVAQLRQALGVVSARAC